MIRGTIEGSLGRRVAFLMLGILGVFSLTWKSRKIIKINGSLGWIFLFFLSWASLSIVWAEDNTLAFRRIVILAMFCLGAIAVIKRFAFHDIVRFTFFSTCFYLILGLLAEFVLGTFRPFATGYRFTGTLHPNQQGMNCALLFLSGIIAAQTAKHGRKLFLIFAVVGLLFLILTKSRTPFASAMIAFLAYWSLISSASRKFKFILIGGCCFSLLLFLAGDAFFPALKQVILLGRVDYNNTLSLTGRIPLWNEVLEYVAKRPLLGYGYGAFWTPLHIFEFSIRRREWAISGACSSYLEMALSLGLAGMIAYVLMFIVGIRRSFVYYKVYLNSGYVFLNVLLIFSVTDGLMESGFNIASPGLISFLIWIALMHLGFIKPDKRHR
jgi:O-antigen ligase